MDCYILHSFLLVTIFLFIIFIICYDYVKHRSKQKDSRTLTKWNEEWEIKKACIKNCSCYYFDDIIKIENFDFENILLVEKSYETILLYVVSYKNLIDAKPLRIIFSKVDYVGTKYLVLLGPEKDDAIFD